MLINNKNLIKTIKRIDLTNEQETNLNEMPEIKKNINDIKTIIGDNENGLIKDVKNLKENAVSQDSVNTAINNYFTEHPVTGGATAEQAAQIEANRTAIGDENSGLIKEVNDLTESLSNVDAVSLNGKKFSEPMTKAEYDAIDNKDSNTIYLIDDDYSVIGVPNFTQADTEKYLAVNSDGTALAWVDAPSGSGTSIEIINDLTTGGATKALSAEQGKALKGNISSIETRVSAIESVGGNVDTSAITSLVEIVPSNNLFDYTQIMKNYSFTNASGSTVTGNFFKLPIANGEKYATNLSWKPVHYFNEDGTHIKTQMYQDNFVITPINENENYCLVTLDNTNYTDNSIVHIIEGINLDHYYDSYSITKDSKSRWFGKKWLVIGDSITFERKGLSGDLANKTYAGIVAKDLGFKYYINEAIAGRTYDYYNSKVSGFISDYDLVTVMLGTNDHGYNTPVGTVTDTTNATIAGRVDIMIKSLIQKNPNAVIAIFTPIKRVGTGDQASSNDSTGYFSRVGGTTKEVCEIIKEKCRLYSIPCLDLYDAIEPLNLTIRKKYFINAHLEDGDGTHPNQDGHAKYIAPKVKAFLESIAPYDNYYEVINDNIVISNTKITITEGNSATITVSLSEPPTSSQTISITSDNSDVTVSPTSLTFDSSNYSATLTITASEDGDYVNDIANITFSSINVANKVLVVNVTDNDQPPTLQSITAVYAQGNTTVYPDTSLDTLKNNLVVTANYSDSSTQTVTDYDLSGSLSVGTSSVTVSYQGKTTTFNVTVSEKPADVIKVNSVSLNKTSHSCNVDDIVELTASIVPSNATNQAVTFTSDNANVSINQTGLSATITAVSSGTSIITVTTADGNKTATCTINIAEQLVGDINSLIFDFTGKNSETTSLSSTGTLEKTLTFNAETLNSNGLAQGKTISFYDAELMNNFNNKDFLFICKWKTDNDGVSPMFVNSTDPDNGYMAFINHGVRNKFKFRQGYPSFYKERFAYVDTYERPENDDINTSYLASDTSANNAQIPYDTNEHTIAYAYIKASNIFKIYVDGEYKDNIEIGEYIPNWTGMIIGSNATIFYKILVQDYVPSDSQIRSMMNSL